MKIINIIKAILLLSVVITLPSCLDLDPKAQLADANLWQTPNDYKLYANQFYEWPRDFAAALFDGPHSDTRSDLITSSDYNEYSKGVNTRSARQEFPFEGLGTIFTTAPPALNSADEVYPSACFKYQGDNEVSNEYFIKP